ncbi:Sucrose transport protein SUT4 [Hondaea fermentalgiana]|uniref:Sucrose transport protein SUT4 n=1 Tax=Hondaea fermentalgiana TaxID=2315210 RepID=A0A2R5G9R2_9STRA|nr:Sucrose transport protein SUT4 [Hondaea fermentalgiana]|eukprot:GBG26468.1 Sucrose transport protein SUT4 [Hondaea fermentalgiana]
MEPGLSSREDGDKGARKRRGNGAGGGGDGSLYEANKESVHSENNDNLLYHHRDASDPYAERSSLIEYEAALFGDSSANEEHAHKARGDPNDRESGYAYNKLGGNETDTPQLRKDAEDEHVVVAVFRIVLMCLAQVGSAAINVAYISLMLPQQVWMIVGNEHKGRTLGLLSGIGGILSIVLPPFVGYASDRYRSQYGRRKPFMAAGLSTMGFSFLIAGISANTNDLAAIGTIYIVSVVGGILLSTAFNATIPDMAEPTQYGTISGVVGALTIVGYGIGAGIGAASTSIGIPASYYLLDAVIVVTGVITLNVYKEDVFLPSGSFSQRKAAPASAKGSIYEFEPASDDDEEEEETEVKDSSRTSRTAYCGRARRLVVRMAGPFAENGFFWVFVTRLLVQFGVFTVMQFMLFWVSDVLPFQGLEATTRAAILFAPVFCTALISSLSVGRLTDLNGGKRKTLLITSSIVLGMCSFGVAFIENFIVAMVFMLIFGTAMGTFMSLDYALVCDVLPSTANVARDLGVWHISIVLPQLVAAPIAGALLDVMNNLGGKHGLPHVGYSLIFIVAAIYFFAASACFLKLKNVA